MAEPATTPAPAAKARIFVVDDEEGMCFILQKALSAEGYAVVPFTDPSRAIEAIQKDPPDVVLTDLKMPSATGMDVLRATRSTNADTNVILMTAHGSIESAIEAMRAGAFDYVMKPFKLDEITMTLDRALERRRLLSENQALSDALARPGRTTTIVGESPQIRDLVQLVYRVAASDSAVLIRGESGTGKELVARMMHDQSRRRDKRFVAINCASIPENLLESELFGYEKGAFTGAQRTKMGLVELASGGTLFLDEIGEMPIALQAKLLRVLQEQEVLRVGGLHPIKVDVRLVAATNRDLEAAIEQRQFREDLFYRLNVISLRIPPLRDRRDDVPLLAQFFLERLRRKFSRPALSISPEAIEVLRAYSFPGNVRELENLLERAAVLAATDTIQPSDLSGLDARAVPGGTEIDADYRSARDAFERSYIVQLLERAGGNVTEAARLSGMSRRNLYEKLERLNIKPER